MQDFRQYIIRAAIFFLTYEDPIMVSSPRSISNPNSMLISFPICRNALNMYMYRISPQNGSSSSFIFYLIDFLSETAPLGESSPSTSRLTKHYIAWSTNNNGLCMTEDSCNLKASGTLDIHKETIRALHQAFELVGASILLRCWIQKIDRHSELFSLKRLYLCSKIDRYLISYDMNIYMYV